MIIHKKYAIILDKYSKRSYNYSSMIIAEVNMKKIHNGAARDDTRQRHNKRNR